MDLIADFEAVIAEVREARPVPLSASAIIDRKDLLRRLEALLEAIPGELKKARWVIEDRDEVLGRIHREAQETLEQARRERDRMLSRPEIDRAASAEAERVIEGAKTQAREIRLEAEHFVDGKLASLEVGLQKMLALVQCASGSFPDRSGEPRPSPVPKRPVSRPPATPEDEAAALRPVDPLQMPHDEARPVQAQTVKRRPAPKSTGEPAKGRPKAQRPAPRAVEPAEPRRPDAAKPGPGEETSPNMVRSLGLGAPQVRKPVTPPPGPAAQSPGRPEGPAPAKPPPGPRIIRLVDEPPPSPARSPASPAGGEGTAPAAPRRPEPPGGARGGSGARLF